MNTLKKVICCVLAVLLLVSACACGEGTETETQEETRGDVSTVADSEVETQESLDIPTTRYDGEELVFLTRDEGEWSSTSIFAEKDDISEDPISDAVYTRNDKIYQQYGVTIKEYREATKNMSTKVQTEISAPTGDFQAVISNVSVAANLSNNAFIWDLYSEETSNLDLSKSWWDQKFVEGFDIEGRVFFATGDLLTLDNDATFAMLFNKTIAAECQIPDLYSMVSNYEWTFDKMYEYEVLATNDSNGNGKLDYNNDVAGFAITGDVPYSMFYAGGLCVIAKDEEGSLSFGLNVERAQNVADSAKRIFDEEYVVNMSQIAINEFSGDMTTVNQACFGEGHALFFSEVLQSVTRLRGNDVDFGVIPYPMYDTNQNAYYHMMHSTGSVVSIPRSVEKDIEMVSAMIEAMAYYSVDTLTKQYYEINLTTKSVKDEQSGPMIDLILASRVCDLGYYYGWGNAVGTFVSALNPNSNTSIASSAKSLTRVVNKQIDNALKKFNDNYT